MLIDSDKIGLRREVIFWIAYYVLYLDYLLVNPENELMHWVTLVGLPLLLLSSYYTRVGGLSFKSTLRTCGLRKGNLKGGLLWSTALGLVLSVLQLFVSRQSDELWKLIRSGNIFILFPLAFLLLVLTAGFTEEFFFRGILLTRLEVFFGSKFWSILTTAFLFGLYHFPYAYLNPNWPSHGNLLNAFLSALAQGVPAGLILGFVYVRSEHNLIASVLVHTLADLLPAMTMIKLSGA